MRTVVKSILSALILTILSAFIPAGSEKELPETNQKIIDYVETVIGKQVDRGECWDLAYRALTLANAEWNMEYVYGKRLKPDKDEIFPGDLIQFKGVKIRYQKGRAIYTEVYDHHTAIIYRVIDKGIFELAHQNTDFSGRKVGLSEFNMANKISGKMYFYRPVAKAQ